MAVFSFAAARFGITVFTQVVGQIGGEPAVFVSQADIVLIAAGFGMSVSVARILVVARRILQIRFQTAERRAVVTHGSCARTGADICPQTQCAGFVQPCVDGIHLIEQVIHMTRTDFTEPAFQTDEGITAAPISAVAFV